MDGVHLEVNAEAARMLGYKSYEIIGQSYDFTVAPGEGHKARAIIDGLRAGHRFPPYERFFRHREGHIVPVEITVSLIHDDDGQPLHIQSIARDITERKQVESALRERERLQIALQKETELSELKTKMMQRVSHEFRTPLSVIVTSTDLLNRHYDQLSPEKRRQRFVQIATQVDHMTHMLDDIALAIKGQFNALTFQPSRFDLAQLCQRIVIEMSSGPGADHHLVFTPSGSLYSIHADSSLIRLIVNNLLSNAFKYAAAGTTVHLDVAAAEGWLTLTVRDQGIGITLEDQSRIFDPFYRGSNFDERPGLGLGLSIVQDAVALHGGEIALDSSPGVGTAFIVRLPIH
jgi:PAS domain S-box-containing protein